MRGILLLCILAGAAALSFEALETERIALAKLRDEFDARDKRRAKDLSNSVVERVVAGRVEAAASLAALMSKHMTERLTRANYNGTITKLNLVIRGGNETQIVREHDVGDELVPVSMPVVLDVLSAYKELQTAYVASWPPLPIPFTPYMVVHGIRLDFSWSTITSTQVNCTLFFGNGDPVANNQYGELNTALYAVKNEEKIWKERAWERPLQGRASK